MDPVSRRKSLVRAMALVLMTSAVASVPPVLVAMPVAAECTGSFTPMPPFTEVAGEARRIVVGVVEGYLREDGGVDTPTGTELGIAAGYRVRVGDVLRGTAHDTIDIRGLRTRRPQRSGDCSEEPIVYARPGDIIAIAYGGRMRGVQHRVTAAAWIAGEPSELMPRAQRLTEAEVFRASGATASVPSPSLGCPAAPPLASPSTQPSPPPTASPTPSSTMSPVQSPVSDAISDSTAQALALLALRSYIGDLQAGRSRSAWTRLSAQERARWGSHRAFHAGVDEHDSTVVSMVDDPATVCASLGATDTTGLNMSKAWLGTVTHGPVAQGSTDSWLVAPGPAGYFVLTEVR